MRSHLAAVLVVFSLCSSDVTGQPQPPAVADSPQLAFEIRVLTLSDAFFERIGLDFDEKIGALTDTEMKTLIEAVQGDRRSTIVQAPKVTTLSDEEVVVSMTEQRGFTTRLEVAIVKGEPVLIAKETMTEIGMKFAVTGRLSADGKTVETKLKYSDTQVVGEVPLVPVVTYIRPVQKDGTRGKSMPLTQYLQAPQFETVTIDKEKLVIPSGGHAMILGPTKMREVRSEFSPPALARIPYVNRLYKNIGIGRETTRAVLLVTARVVDAK